MNTQTQTLGDRLLLLMESRRMSQADLAREMGMGRATVNQWILGKNQPGAESAFWLAEFFNTDMAYLLWGASGPVPDRLPPFMKRKQSK